MTGPVDTAAIRAEMGSGGPADVSSRARGLILALSDEVDRLRAGESDEPVPEGVVPTPAQFLRRLNDAHPVARLLIAEQVMQNATDAAACLLRGHESRIRSLAGELTAARVRIDELAYEVQWRDEWSNTLAGHVTDAYDDDGSQEACVERWLADLMLGARALLGGDQRGLLLVRHALTDDTPTEDEWHALDALRDGAPPPEDGPCPHCGYAPLSCDDDGSPCPYERRGGDRG